MKDNQKVVVIVGPSGSGKTTITKLLEHEGIVKITTTTSRAIREDEVHGIDYYFTTKGIFSCFNCLAVTTYHQNYYGVSKGAIASALHKSDIVSIVLDAKGAEELKKLYPKNVTVIYLQVTEDDMETHMLTRGDDKVLVSQRLKHASDMGELEVPSIADFCIQVNSLENSVDSIMNILKDNK